MSALLTIRDETASGSVLRTFSLGFPTNYTTIRELIAARVRHEVETYNAQPSEPTFRGLVQPSGAEPVRDGFKLAKRRTIDAEEQIARALEAFGRNGFLVLIGDHQAESLDEGFLIQPGTEVSFVKLVQLVGG
jgi:hypothetical protein